MQRVAQPPAGLLPATIANYASSRRVSVAMCAGCAKSEHKAIGISIVARRAKVPSTHTEALAGSGLSSRPRIVAEQLYPAYKAQVVRGSPGRSPFCCLVRQRALDLGKALRVHRATRSGLAEGDEAGLITAKEASVSCSRRKCMRMDLHQPYTASLPGSSDISLKPSSSSRKMWNRPDCVVQTSTPVEGRVDGLGR